MPPVTRGKAAKKTGKTKNDISEGAKKKKGRKVRGDEVDSLQEIFKCVICMEKLKDAHLCPHCSKLCCFICIKRWLNTERGGQCPHCRVPLLLKKIVKCRWVGEVNQQLSSLQSSTAENLVDDRCNKHHKKFTVYCIECSMSICHQCALWSDGHSGHTFKPLEEEYQRQKVQVEKNDIPFLKNWCQEITAQIQDVERNEESLRNAAKTKITQLNSLLNSKLLKLTDQRNQLSQEAEQIETAVQNIESNLQTCSSSQFMTKGTELSRMAEQLRNKPMTCFSSIPIPVDFQTVGVPSYDSGSFTLQQFSVLQREGNPVYSPPLTANGLCWTLKVYPDGIGAARGNYLSVYLQLSAGFPEASNYECRVEMLHEDPSKNIIHESAVDFEAGKCNWGYARFFRLDRLATRGYLNLETDTLQLRFQVRAPTFYQLCRDQQWFISELLKTQNEHISQIADLRERLEPCGVSPSTSSAMIRIVSVKSIRKEDADEVMISEENDV